MTRSPVPRLMLAAAALAVLAAFVPLVLWSLSDRWFAPAPWPQQWGLRAWRMVFGGTGDQILTGLAHSVTVALTAAALALAAGLPAGRALGLYRFRGKPLIALLLVLPLIVPPLSVAMGLHLWFIRLGLADRFAGVILVHLTSCTPYAIFVLWGVYAAFDPDFEAQARSLGAGPLQVLWRVTLPLIRPGVVVAGLFAFLLSWSQYLSTLIIGGGRVVTLPVLLFALMASGDRPVAAAVSLLFVLPALVALLASTRFLNHPQMTGIR